MTSTIIHDLPFEILGEIFLLCLPNDPLNHRQPDTTIPPMLLCKVCSNWRRVAFNTPTLWVYLYYVAKVSKGYRWQARWLPSRQVDIEFLASWIRNSRATPLIFRFEFDFTNDKPNGLLEWWRMEEITEVDPRVLFFRTVWANARGLYLNTFVFNLLQKQISRKHLRFPNLRSLANLEYSSSNIPIELLHLDTLRHLIYHDYQTLDKGIGWTYLTHISIRKLSISAVDWCTLIRRLEALQVAEFAAYVDRTDISGVEYPSKDLPHLRELRLLLCCWDINFNPLPNLVFPSLTTLHYDGPNINSIFLHNIFLSSPELMALHLGCSSPSTPVNTSELLLSGWGVWDYALRLEELIIDDFVSWRSLHNQMWLWLHFHLLPPPKLERLVFVNFTTKLSAFQRSIFKWMEWYLLWRSRINVVLRKERQKDYWMLSPSECREWMEIQWYVATRYNIYFLDQNFRIETSHGEYGGSRLSGNRRLLTLG